MQIDKVKKFCGLSCKAIEAVSAGQTTSVLSLHLVKAGDLGGGLLSLKHIPSYVFVSQVGQSTLETIEKVGPGLGSSSRSVFEDLHFRLCKWMEGGMCPILPRQIIYSLMLMARQLTGANWMRTSSTIS